MTLLQESGKWLIVGFFLASGLANLTQARIADHIQRMHSGCVLLVAGWHPALGVGWQKSDPVQRNLSRLSFLANVAILGGLLLLLADVL